MEQHWASGGVFADARLREAFEHVLAMKEAGATKIETDAYLRTQFPNAGNDRRDRFTCRTCLDEGLALIWSQRAILACLKGKFDDRKNRTTCRIACECDRGRAFVGTVENGKPKPMFTRCYDPRLDCLCDDPEDIESIGALERWCDEKRNEKPANYETRFDDYNNRQHEEPF